MWNDGDGIIYLTEDVKNTYGRGNIVLFQKFLLDQVLFSKYCMCLTPVYVIGIFGWNEMGHVKLSMLIRFDIIPKRISGLLDVKLELHELSVEQLVT